MKYSMGYMNECLWSLRALRNFKLTHLDLSCCHNITNNFLKSLVHLRTLRIYYCGSIDSDSFKDMTNLRELKLCGINVKHDLSQLTNLHTLWIHCVSPNVEHIKNLTQLRDLRTDGGGFKLTDEILVRFQELETLSTHYADVTGTSIKQLTKLRDLTMITCDKIELDTETLARLQHVDVWCGHQVIKKGGAKLPP
jgi:hypothetical protein